MVSRDTHRLSPATARSLVPLPVDRIGIDGPATLLFPALRAWMKHADPGRDPKGSRPPAAFLPTRASGYVY